MTAADCTADFAKSSRPVLCPLVISPTCSVCPGLGHVRVTEFYRPPPLSELFCLQAPCGHWSDQVEIVLTLPGPFYLLRCLKHMSDSSQTTLMARDTFDLIYT